MLGDNVTSAHVMHPEEPHKEELAARHSGNSSTNPIEYQPNRVPTQ